MILINEPQDGWDALERMFLKEVILNMYRTIICPISETEEDIIKQKKQISDLTNAFIFMAINESGYTQDEVASIFKISQVAVQKRLKNTTEKVRKKGI
jgi:predicted HTH transcriptional regulator